MSWPGVSGLVIARAYKFRRNFRCLYLPGAGNRADVRAYGVPEGFLPRVSCPPGLALDHPENTPGAFHAALAAGADILETDVHVSRDGVVVIAHDPDLTRVAGRSGLVSDFTADELASIDLDSGQGFPTLDQVLTEFPTAKFKIDLKTCPAVEPFAEVIFALTELRSDPGDVVR